MGKEIKACGYKYRTTNYDMFKLMKENREIKQARVTKVKNSIEKNGWIDNPIVVNEGMYVIDGQARLTACKELNIPITYTVAKGAGLKECIALNQATTAWQVPDYIRAYKEQGIQDYVLLDKLIQDHKGLFKGNMMHSIMGGGFGKLAADVIACRISLNQEKYEAIDKAVSFLETVEPYLKNCEGDIWILKTAIVYACFMDNVDNRKLARRLRSYGLKKPAIIVSVKTAFDFLTKIYNFGSKKTDVRIDIYNEWINKETTADGWYCKYFMRVGQ